MRYDISMPEIFASLKKYICLDIFIITMFDIEK